MHKRRNPCAGYKWYPARKMIVYLFNYLVIWPLLFKWSQDRENNLALAARNSCAIKHPSVLLVPFIEENDKKLPVDSLSIRRHSAHASGSRISDIWKNLCTSSIVMMEPCAGYWAYPFSKGRSCWLYQFFFFALYSSDRWREGFPHEVYSLILERIC